MSRALAWVIRRVGTPTLLILTCLAVAILSVAWALSATVRGLDFELLATMALLGAGTGWMLAGTRARTRVVLPLALGIGVATILGRVGQLGGNLLALCAALARFVWEAQFQKADLQPIAAALTSFGAAVLTLLTRVSQWGNAVGHAQSGFDPVASALVWSAVVWVITAWAAWRVQRAARPFDALLPAIVVLGLVLAYSGSLEWVMLLVGGAWLGLMVIVPLLARERRWEREGVPYAEELGFDLTFVVIPAITGILVLAMVVPVLSPSNIVGWVEQWTSGQSNPAKAIPDSLGLVPAAIPRPNTVFDELSSPGLPRSHLLGAGPELLGKLALTIQTDDPTTEPNGYYWLSSTYDQYTGHGWFTSGFRLQDYHADERAIEMPLPSYRTVHATIHAENSSGIVYAPGILASVDHAFQAAWRSPGDMFGAQVNTNTYRVESFVPVFDAKALRSASDVYPDWVRAWYMTLPDNVPPRVLALARDLTATAPTPYDRAVALETYLRTIPYTLDVPAPPADRDVVDYFLFDLHRGYCDYFATAMAVLARAAGLPARIAVGYAPGKYDSQRGEYVVTEAEAHSWTQVYFTGYGWVDFEPTSGRDALTYDAPESVSHPSPAETQMAFDGSFVQVSRALAGTWFLVPGLLGLLGASAWLWMVGDTWRLQRMPSTLALAVLYRRIYRAANFLGVAVTPSHTPSQVATLLAAHFAQEPAKDRRAWLWQPVSGTFFKIIELYVRATYGADLPDPQEKAALIRAWKNSYLRVLLLVVLLRIQYRAAKIKSSRLFP